MKDVERQLRKEIKEIKELKSVYDKHIFDESNEFYEGQIIGLRTALDLVKKANKEARVGVMDKIAFDYELGNAADGNEIYPSVEDMIKYDPHMRAFDNCKCGIVRVRVYLDKIIKKEKY